MPYRWHGVTDYAHLDFDPGDLNIRVVPDVCLAELIATGQTPDLIEPFALSRFRDAQLVGEKAAAAVSH